MTIEIADQQASENVGLPDKTDYKVLYTVDFFKLLIYLDFWAASISYKA